MTAAERFQAKIAIDPATGCWLWTGYRQPNGYGLFGIGSRTDGTRRRVFVHRWAYEHYIGPIPEGTTIDHVRARGCIHRHCANPEHLEAVPHSVNLHRGDTIAARNAAKTCCPAGHPYEGENLFITKTGDRKCRTCHRERVLANYHALTDAERAERNDKRREYMREYMRKKRASG